MPINRRVWIVALALVIGALAASPLTAQTVEENPHRDAVLVSANLLAPIVGIYTGSVESAVAPNLSVFVQPEYFNFRWSVPWFLLVTLDPELKDFDFNMTLVGGRAGVHYFPGRVHDGFFVGGSVGYARMTFRYEEIRVPSDAFRVMARGGYRVILGQVALTPFAELGVNLLMTDFTDLYARLGLDEIPFLEDEMLDFLVARQFGFAFGLGISIALALY
jgi:hypothetical protein